MGSGIFASEHCVAFTITTFVIGIVSLFFTVLGAVSFIAWSIRKLRLKYVGGAYGKKYYKTLKDIENDTNTTTEMEELEYIQSHLSKTPSGYYKEFEEIQGANYKIINRMDIAISDLTTEINTKWNGVKELMPVAKRLNEDIRVIRSTFTFLYEQMKTMSEEHNLMKQRYDDLEYRHNQQVLLNEELQSASKHMCITCKTRSKNVIMMPCGCFFYCNVCVQEFKHKNKADVCPKCNKTYGFMSELATI